MCGSQHLVNDLAVATDSKPERFQVAERARTRSLFSLRAVRLSRVVGEFFFVVFCFVRSLVSGLFPTKGRCADADCREQYVGIDKGSVLATVNVLPSKDPKDTRTAMNVVSEITIQTYDASSKLRRLPCTYTARNAHSHPPRKPPTRATWGLKVHSPSRLQPRVGSSMGGDRWPEQTESRRPIGGMHVKAHVNTGMHVANAGLACDPMVDALQF